MPWVCPSCGFDGNDDSIVRCICGYELTADQERNDPKPARRWAWKHFIAGFLISFFFISMDFLFDFLGSKTFLGSEYLAAFMISLVIGVWTGFFGGKFVRFLLELFMS
jgi:hypothetical protein